MTSPAPAPAPSPAAGLRERKKAKTRWAIQDHALRLFAEQGYDNTTVDQIAAAAEISPSTFFRYFRTKEDVVVQDEFDDDLFEAYSAAGAAADPLDSLRRSVIEVLSAARGEARTASEQRTALIFSVPALRARTVENVLGAFEDATKRFAAGSGRAPDDPGVVMFVGATIGALLPVFVLWARGGFTQDLDDLVTRGFDELRELLGPR